MDTHACRDGRRDILDPGVSNRLIDRRYVYSPVVHTIRLPMHNFPEDVFEAIENEETIRVTGVVTGKFCIHRAGGQRTSTILVCPRILRFPNRLGRGPIFPVARENDTLSQSHDLYEEGDGDGKGGNAAEEEGHASRGRRGSEIAHEETKAPKILRSSDQRHPSPRGNSARHVSDASEDEETRDSRRGYQRRKGAVVNVETDVETDSDSAIGELDEEAGAFQGPTRMNTRLDLEYDESGPVGDGNLDDLSDGEDGSGMEEYGEEDRQGGLDSEDDGDEALEDGAGTDVESLVEDGGADAGGSDGVISELIDAYGRDVEDEDEVESYVKVEGESAGEEVTGKSVGEEAIGDSESDMGEDDGVSDSDMGEDDGDEGGDEDGSSGAETETNSAAGSDETDCSNLLAEDQEEEDDPEADYEESGAEDAAGVEDSEAEDAAEVEDSDADKSGAEYPSDGFGEGDQEISSPIRPVKRRLQIPTDDEDEDANIPPRKRRSS